MALTKVSGSVLKDPLSLGGEVSIGGTLTYQDVTNVDAIGIITARAGVNVSAGQLDVGSNVKIGNSGVATATNFKTGSSDLHSTGLTVGNNFFHSTGINVGTGATIHVPSSNVLTLGTNSNERLRITSSGQIGIGTDNPHSSYRFDIRHSADNILHLGQGAATLAGMANNSWNAISFQGTNCEFGLYKDGSGNFSYIMGTYQGSTAIPIIFRTGNREERLRIDKSGSIGIGSIFYHLGDTNTDFGFPSNDSFLLRVNGESRIYTHSSEAIWNRRDANAGITTQTMLINYNTGAGTGCALGFAPSGVNYNSRHSSIEVVNEGNNQMTMRFKVTDPSVNDHARERMRIATNGKIGINNTNPTHPFHIVNTSSTFNSASLIKGDTSTSGGGAYATFTNTADSKSAYFGVDGNGLFNLDAGAALVGTNGDEPIIFATNGNDEKVRILGGSGNVLQMGGGSKVSITDYAPNFTSSGNYAGFHHDNHGNTLIALNASLNYSGTSGTHQWKQNNAHPTIGSAGIFMGGNGSNNNSMVSIFSNSQGNSAGQVFAQDSWKLRIGGSIVQNDNIKYETRGYFYTNTSNQNATTSPSLAGGLSYGFGYQEAYSTTGGTWVHPYPDLVLAYHTGTSFGSYRHYGGCRFFQDHPSGNTSTVLEVGNGSTGVHVTGYFTAGSNKGFRIAHPHPSKKYTHDLVHNAIEAPQMDLIYRGKIDLVNGSATVNIDTKANMTDGTFVLLNRDVQCFTSNETGWTAVKGSVSGNILTITAENNSCTDTISWMVVGERQDDKIKGSELSTDDGVLITEPLTIEATHM